MRTRGKVYPYIVVLKHPHAFSLRLVGLLTIGMASALLALNVFRPEGSGLHCVALFFCIVMVIWNLLQWKNRKPKFSLAPALLAAGLSLLLLPPHSGIGILFLLAGLLEKQALMPVEIGFSGEHILVYGFRKTRYQWSELSAVLLKDGILTMDFRDNRLFQKAVDDADDEDYDGDEDEFNKFCASMIESDQGDKRP